MDFINSAGTVFAGHACEICDSETSESQPVYVDVDGGYGDDGSQIRVRVRHQWCHEHEIAAVARSAHKLWMEAWNMVTYHNLSGEPRKAIEEAMHAKVIAAAYGVHQAREQVA